MDSSNRCDPMLLHLRDLQETQPAISSNSNTRRKKCSTITPPSTQPIKKIMMNGRIQRNTIPVLSRAELESVFASFVGMEGGNPKAAFWVCDVAPAASSLSVWPSFTPQPIPGSWDANFRRRYAEQIPRWQTHSRISRVLAAARKAAVPGDLPIGALEYFNRYLYAPEGWDFKLNLFPLRDRPDPVRPWGKTFNEQPELRSRPAYIRLCREGGRFRFLSDLRKLHRPRVILGLGHRYARDYARAFGFCGGVSDEVVLQPADTAQRLQVYEHEETVLVICPPFGGGRGLSSDVLLDALGVFVSQWLRPEDYPAFDGVLAEGGEPASARIGTSQCS